MRFMDTQPRESFEGMLLSILELVIDQVVKSIEQGTLGRSRPAEERRSDSSAAMEDGLPSPEIEEPAVVNGLAVIPPVRDATAFQSSKLRVSNNSTQTSFSLGARLVSHLDRSTDPACHRHFVEDVEKGSRAQELGLRNRTEIICINGIDIRDLDHESVVELIRCSGSSRSRQISLNIKHQHQFTDDVIDAPFDTGEFLLIRLTFRWKGDAEFEIINFEELLGGWDFWKDLILHDTSGAKETTFYIEHFHIQREREQKLFLCANESEDKLCTAPLQENCKKFLFKTYVYGGCENSPYFTNFLGPGKDANVYFFKTVEEEVARCIAVVDDSTVVLQQINKQDPRPDHPIEGILRTTTGHDTRYFWRHYLKDGEGFYAFESTVKPRHFLAVDQNGEAYLKHHSTYEELCRDSEVAFKTWPEDEVSKLDEAAAVKESHQHELCKCSVMVPPHRSTSIDCCN